MNLLLIVLFGITAKVKQIEVRVESNQKGINQQDVQLLGFLDGEPKSNITQKTDRNGRTSFRIEESDEAWVTRTVYQGLQYVSDIYKFQNIKSPIILKVHQTTESLESLKILSRRISVSEADKLIKVEEDISVENQSNKAVIGKSLGDQNPTLISIELPAGASDLQMISGFNSEETRIEQNSIIVSSPLLPGITRFSFAYFVGPSKGSLKLTTKSTPSPDRVFLALDSSIMKVDEKLWTKRDTKLFEGKELIIRSTDQPPADFYITGLPDPFPWTKLVPFLTLLILFIVGFISQRKLKSN